MHLDFMLLSYDCLFVPDLSLFDELDSLGDADDLLVALEKGSYVNNIPFQYTGEYTMFLKEVNKKNSATEIVISHGRYELVKSVRAGASLTS